MPTGIMVRMFTNGPGDRGSIPGRAMPKNQKMVLDASLTLSVIRYGQRVSGAIQRNEYCSHLHLGVVAREKEAFGSPSTTVGQLYIYIYIYRERERERERESQRRLV